MTNPGLPHSTIDQQQKRFDQPRSKGAQENLRYRLAASIALLAFFLITISIVVSMRGKTTQQPADLARVTVQEATIVGPLVQHNVPTATVLLKNTGHSPALTTKVRLVMTVWTSNKFPDWDMPLQPASDAQSIGTVALGAVVPQTISLITPLTDVQGMHLERKDWFIVILGVVSYADVSGKPHETKLCLIWRDTTTEHLSPCEKWNETN